jgi:hypothetical protein|uniref:Uncharacterized protein n=1 Tax=viral metagenome TaxID=1070528 RepID=A0A6C0E750_9ZZZZ
MFSGNKKNNKYDAFGNLEKKACIDKQINIDDKVRILEDLLMKIAPTLIQIQENAKKEKDNEYVWTPLYDELVEDLIEVNLFDKKPDDISIGFKRPFLKSYVKNNL